jgi:hypothetical protein
MEQLDRLDLDPYAHRLEGPNHQLAGGRRASGQQGEPQGLAVGARRGPKPIRYPASSSSRFAAWGSKAYCSTSARNG